MSPLSAWHAEQLRFAGFLRCVGYVTENASDSSEWLFAANLMAPALGFRVGPHFVCLYAEYFAGRTGSVGRQELLREVNRLNAIHWLVRSTLISRESGTKAQFVIRLQANLPMGLPEQELGACLLAWIRESTYVERAASLWAWSSQDVASDGDRSRDAIDDLPTQAPKSCAPHKNTEGTNDER